MRPSVVASLLALTIACALQGQTTPPPAETLVLQGTSVPTQIEMRGKEFFQGLSDADHGIGMFLGVNRGTNRQLWLLDTARLAVNNTNPALRFHLGAATSYITAHATDGVTGQTLILNALGGNVLIGPNNGGGNVGIGTGTPTSKLFVLGSVKHGIGLTGQQQIVVDADMDTTSEVGAEGAVYDTVRPGVTHTAAVQGARGMVYLNDTGTLTTATGVLGQIYINGSGTINYGYGLFARAWRGNGTLVTGFGVYIDDTKATYDYGLYQVAEDDSNYLAGDVTIGKIGVPPENLVTKLQVNGHLNVQGDITGARVIHAVYQDVAEWVPATEDMAPGTVVVLNASHANEVRPSSSAYDTTVAGVVSAQPGVILGHAGPSKEQVATTGRVKVRVDATIAPIAIGDLLVTSDKPGTAMKSEPIEISGRTFHQPGTIIGKALEPLESGGGEILVLLSLQ